MRRLVGVSVSFILLLFALPVLGDDASAITVHLKDGGMLRGELVERAPGSHVTVKLATGEVRRIEWSAIDHDSIGTPPKTPTPPSPPSAAYPASTEGGVVVSGADGVLVQQKLGDFVGSGYAGSRSVAVVGEAWSTVCVAPCNRALEPGEYRVTGDGVTTSSTFRLGGGPARLRVEPGNATMAVSGYMLTTLGIGGGLAGVAGMVLLGKDENEPGLSLSAKFAIGGGVATAIGIPLWLAGRTKVEVQPGSGIAWTPRGIVF